jgi:hypothetical protein
MSNCKSSSKYPNNLAGGCSRNKKSLKNLDEIVDHYIEYYRESAKDELLYMANQSSLRAAVRVAALAIRAGDGKRYDHQRRIPLEQLEGFRRGLMRKRSLLQSCENFHQLFEIAKSVAAGIWKKSELTVYDTAHRIGVYLGLNPSRVYLHAGTREGARNLGFRGRLLFIMKDQLPRAFHKLKPYEIEDCLCIYKDQLRNVRC